MKKLKLFLIFTILLTAIMLLLTVSASAEDTVYSGTRGDLTWELNATTGELVISGEGGMSGFSSYSTSAWLSYKNSIKSVTISEGVTTIGSYAFYQCSSLETVTFGENSKLTSIGGGAFYNCTGLTSIIIPASVTSIGESAFYGCTWLQTVNFGEDSKLTSINNWAFYRCTSLTSITIPDSVTSIGRAAFYDCSGLTGVYITDLEAWCNLQIDLYDASPLYYARNLYLNGNLVTSLEIPNSVTSVGGCAFTGCNSLTSITIPESVTSIGSYAFSDCSSLESITVKAGNTKYHSDGNCLIETESKTLLAGCKNSIIPTDGSVTSIGGCAFYHCSSLTSITIPDSVTSIGWCAFEGCSALTSINIPMGVTEIDIQTFWGCTSLATITLPASVTSINLSAFRDCSSLATVYLPMGVTEIDTQAFLGCASLTTITIPASVTSIGNSAFRDCSSLSAVYLHSPTIVSALTSSSACGRLLENAKSVYILQSITAIPECITNAYPHANSLTHEGLSYIVYTNPTDHAYNTTLIEHDATQHKKVCECGDTVYAAHEHGAWKEHNETQHKRVCPCGDIEYADHDWNNGVITTPASHTEVGTKTYTCSVCSETKTEDVPKTTAHEYGEWQKHDATQHKRECPCTNVEYADHDWNDGVITTPATHLTLGVKTFTCSDCSETKTEDVPKTTAHEYGEWTTIKEATTSEAGLREKGCACGDKVSEEIPKLTTSASNTDLNSNQSGEPNDTTDGGLGTGAVIGIISGSVVALSGGFALYWFVFRKKKTDIIINP